MPLFDDELARQPRRVTLVRLAAELARAAGAVGRVQVEGEVHRVTTGRTGHRYFTLRDRAAQVSVQLHRNAARSRVVDGERVAVTGILSWTPDRGQMMLVAEAVSPVGAGAIAAQIAETRARLAGLGLLGRTRRPLPLLPARIAVVCGTEAAVIKDIESVVAARFPGYPMHWEPTTVTGPGAASGIVEAMARAARTPGVAVIVLARGGGDATSLLPWSSEEVCMATAHSLVPVVSAIGHDGDRPLCDEVADLRCGTPSLAAAAVVPDRAALERQCAGLAARCRAALDGRTRVASARHAMLEPSGALRAAQERAESRLARAGDRLVWAHPGPRVAAAAGRLDAAPWRRATWELVARAGGRLDADARHARALAPARVLERGYAVVRDDAGRVVYRSSDVSGGDTLHVHLGEGTLLARVESASPSGQGDGS